MLQFAIRYIRRASKRPLVSLSWTLFTAAAIYVAHYYVENPEATSKLEEDAVALRNLEKERAKVESIYLAWDGAVNYDSNSVVAELHRDSVSPDANIRYLAYQEGQRVKIDILRVQVNTIRFTNEAYESIRISVAGDIPLLAEYNEKKITMMKRFFADSAKAWKELSKLEIPGEMQRKYLELHARFETLEETLELARQQHNVQVRSYNSRSKVYRTKAWVNIIATTYMSTFVGYWLGVAAYRRKRKWLRPNIADYRRQDRKKSATQQQPNNSEDGNIQ